MPRNLDMTALRAFVTVADIGSVTRAAGLLHLTQSAVSMQLRRLEEGLGLSLFDRAGRSLALTPAGEQLLGYGRRILDLNDTVYARLTSAEFEGEITVGVPHDIVHPIVPRVLRQFAADYPRMRVNLIASFTKALKAAHATGETDLILTTEVAPDPEGKVLVDLPLRWVGAIGGQAWKKRPLSLAHEKECLFRAAVQRRLDEADIPWTMAVDTETFRASEAMVSADLAVHTMLEGTQREDVELIRHGGALPDLGHMSVTLYTRATGAVDAVRDLAALLTQGFGVRAVDAA